jgi:hypothetical protein
MNTNLQIPTALQPSSLQDQRSGNTSAQASGLGLLSPNSNGLKARNNFSTLEEFEFAPHCGANSKILDLSEASAELETLNAE